MENKEFKDLVHNVTIKEILPLYTLKDNSEATSIELIRFEENDFHIVAGKSWWKVGDIVQYILPDSNLKEGNSYLNEYIYPTRDNIPVSTKLGSNNRVKAIGFNFSIGDGQKIYSNGIIVPANVDISKYVYKHQNDEVANLKTNGGTAFPQGFYKTDEPNFKLIGRTLTYPVTLEGTLKRDGSSISMFAQDLPTKWDWGICSRNLRKPLIIKKQTGVKYSFLGKLFKAIGIKVPSMFTAPVIEEFENNDDFVKVGKPYLDKLVEYFGSEDFENSAELGSTGIVLRGEVMGSGFKGSGNKNNLDAKLETQVQFYGVDLIQNGVTVKKDFRMFKNFDFPRVPILFYKEFQSETELLSECQNLFNELKCEGIVIRQYEDNNVVFSGKLMNDDYDSKK